MAPRVCVKSTMAEAGNTAPPASGEQKISDSHAGFCARRELEAV